MVNRENAVLASDRRLVCTDGHREDESNKAGVLNCRDARLGFAFTGLAECDAFKTRFWLPATLSASAPPDYLMEPLLHRFRERAREQFARLRGPSRQLERLTVVFAGYSYADGTPRAYVWRLSNFEIGEADTPLPEAQDDFELRYWRDARLQEKSSFVMPLGIHVGIPHASLRDLDLLVRDCRPYAALVGKAVAIIREAAEAPASRGMVGSQCSTIVLPSNPEMNAVAEYHTAHPTPIVYWPAYVEAGIQGGLAYAIADPEIRTHEDLSQAEILRVPHVRRNQPCPCGSGLKYKKCHARS